MANPSPLLLCFLLLLCSSAAVSMAAKMGFGGRSGPRRVGGQSECGLTKLDAMEPTRRQESAGGVVEYFDQDGQLQCIGLTVFRRTIRGKSFLMPAYFNSHRIIYIIQGSGTMGIVIPGCPETYRSPGSSDRHQRIHKVSKGDAIAVPGGAAFWCHNPGDTDMVAITVMDFRNSDNQLGQSPRQFLLAGGQQQGFGFGEEKLASENIFHGFDSRMLADSLGVSLETAEKLKGELKDDMVRVSRWETQAEDEEDEGVESSSSSSSPRLNGVEQDFCMTKFRENIDKPSRVDVYSEGGRLTGLNSEKLPILATLQLSVHKGILEKNAIRIPNWNINAHSAMYVLDGSCRVQVVDNGGRRVFDGEVTKGKLLVIPQLYASVKQAVGGRCQWLSFKTTDNPIVSQLIGKGSYFRGVPLDVVVNSYPGISREQARELKYNTADYIGFITPTTHADA